MQSTIRGGIHLYLLSQILVDGPHSAVDSQMGNSADNKMLDLNMECCGETQECLKCQMEKVIQDCL